MMLMYHKCNQNRLLKIRRGVVRDPVRGIHKLGTERLSSNGNYDVDIKTNETNITNKIMY